MKLAQFVQGFLGLAVIHSALASPVNTVEGIIPNEGVDSMEAPQNLDLPTRTTEELADRYLPYYSTNTDFPDPQVGCSGHNLITTYAERNATVWQGGLDTWCLTQNIPPGGMLGFTRVIDFQVYYCSRIPTLEGTTWPCSGYQYVAADNLITAKCGYEQGGWVHIEEWRVTIGRDPTNMYGDIISECGMSPHKAELGG